jgi:hypothetical protein
MKLLPSLILKKKTFYFEVKNILFAKLFSKKSTSNSIKMLKGGLI